MVCAANIAYNKLQAKERCPFVPLSSTLNLKLQVTETRVASVVAYMRFKVSQRSVLR